MILAFHLCDGVSWCYRDKYGNSSTGFSGFRAGSHDRFTGGFYAGFYDWLNFMIDSHAVYRVVVSPESIKALPDVYAVIALTSAVHSIPMVLVSAEPSVDVCIADETYHIVQNYLSGKPEYLAKSHTSCDNGFVLNEM